MQDILIKFLTLVDFKQESHLTKLLNLFEESKIFRPTKWQPDDTLPKRSYNHDEIVQGILENGERYIPSIYRNGKNSYEMVFHLDSSQSIPSTKELNHIHLRMQYPSNNDVISKVFQFSSKFAEVCKPEVGYLLFIRPDMRTAGWSPSVASAPDLQKYGLSGLGVRTWYGTHAMNQIGVDRLETCSGIFRKTDWGGCEIDVLAEPWLVEDFTNLIETQRRIMNQLEPSGAFGDYSSHPVRLYSPAPNWTQIPLD